MKNYFNLTSRAVFDKKLKAQGILAEINIKKKFYVDLK